MFKWKKRNNSLRKDILLRFFSSVMTDDERAKLFGLQEGCRMREGSKILSPENFQCGNHVWIGENAILDASGGLEIGDHSSIGSGVFIWSHTSFMANLTMNNIIGSPLNKRKKTKIGSGCFIAGPSVVYAGVEIGNKVVVSPMSVVTNNIPNNCMIAGDPAKIIREISDELIERLAKR